MTRAELLLKIRFLFSDTAASNLILREPLLARPGNIIDGNNRTFFLLNRRIATIRSVYDMDNVELPVGATTIENDVGKLVFTTPPTSRLYVDYTWYKLTDGEINEAIELAAASGNFNPDTVGKGFEDYAVHYAVANCYMAAAAKSGEYYTLSAAGKQVSKSELFNHHIRMAEKFETSALKLRTDQRTDRGDRDIPADDDSSYDVANPYFPADGGY